MKRLASLLMALCLVMSVPALALNTDEVPGKLKQMVEDYLNPRGLKYEFIDDIDSFKLKYRLDSSMGECEVFIQTYEDMLRLYAVSPVKVPAQNRDKVAALLVRINYYISYGTFHMDYSDGEVTCFALQYVESVLPGPQELGVMLNQALIYLDEWADAINKVGLLGADPQEVYDETLVQLDS